MRAYGFFEEVDNEAGADAADGPRPVTAVCCWSFLSLATVLYVVSCGTLLVAGTDALFRLLADRTGLRSQARGCRGRLNGRKTDLSIHGASAAELAEGRTVSAPTSATAAVVAVGAGAFTASIRL